MKKGRRSEPLKRIADFAELEKGRRCQPEQRRSKARHCGASENFGPFRHAAGIHGPFTAY
jgi:hypothetical protein